MVNLNVIFESVRKDVRLKDEEEKKKRSEEEQAKSKKANEVYASRQRLRKKCEEAMNDLSKIAEGLFGKPSKFSRFVKDAAIQNADAAGIRSSEFTPEGRSAFQAFIKSDPKKGQSIRLDGREIRFKTVDICRIEEDPQAFLVLAFPFLTEQGPSKIRMKEVKIEVLRKAGGFIKPARKNGSGFIPRRGAVRRKFRTRFAGGLLGDLPVSEGFLQMLLEFKDSKKLCEAVLHANKHLLV